MEISAIVPCYNEEKDVALVIKSLLSAPLVSEIIVVDDGSTDKSLSILKSFCQKINLISFKKNRGKAAAVCAGVKKAKGELVLFVDADLHGLKATHLQQMLDAFQKKKADAVLASFVDYKSSSYKFFYWQIWNKMARKISNPDLWTGERLYARKNLLPILPKMKKLGYGLEAFLNHHFKDKKIVVVKLKGVSQPPKEQKTGFNYQTARSYFKEWTEVSQELARQQNLKGKKILEFRKKYFKKFLQAYINPGKKSQQIFKKYFADLFADPLKT